MLDKVLNKVCRAFLKARNKFMELANEESGMETVEVVILVAIAVVVAGVILDFLQGDKGFINTIFTKIETAIGTMLGV